MSILSLKMIKDNIDILLDDTFPLDHFWIDGYSTRHQLRTVAQFLYIREDIPSKMLKFEPVQNNFEDSLLKST